MEHPGTSTFALYPNVFPPSYDNYARLSPHQPSYFANPSFDHTCRMQRGVQLQWTSRISAQFLCRLLVLQRRIFDHSGYYCRFCSWDAATMTGLCLASHETHNNTQILTRREVTSFLKHIFDNWTWSNSLNNFSRESYTS